MIAAKIIWVYYLPEVLQYRLAWSFAPDFCFFFFFWTFNTGKYSCWHCPKTYLSKRALISIWYDCLNVLRFEFGSFNFPEWLIPSFAAKCAITRHSSQNDNDLGVLSAWSIITTLPAWSFVPASCFFLTFNTGKYSCRNLSQNIFFETCTGFYLVQLFKFFTSWSSIGILKFGYQLKSGFVLLRENRLHQWLQEWLYFS